MWTSVSTLLQHVPPRSGTSWFRHASLIPSRAGSPRLAAAQYARIEAKRTRQCISHDPGSSGLTMHPHKQKGLPRTSTRVDAMNSAGTFLSQSTKSRSTITTQATHATNTNTKSIRPSLWF